jgi:hypothetical protein
MTLSPRGLGCWQKKSLGTAALLSEEISRNVWDSGALWRWNTTPPSWVHSSKVAGRMSYLWGSVDSCDFLS